MNSSRCWLIRGIRSSLVLEGKVNSHFLFLFSLLSPFQFVAPVCNDVTTHAPPDVALALKIITFL